MRAWKIFLMLVAIPGLSGIAPAQESTPRVTQSVPEVTGIRTTIIEIPDPHAIRPGEPLTALLYTPAKGENVYSPAIVMIHGGLAGHPARQVGAARFAAERLAAKGYTVLSPMTRHSRDEMQTRFEDIVFDIETSVDALASRGYENIILAGHSMGSVRISYYQAEKQDPRVKALIHFAPTADMAGPGGAAATLIPDYEEKVALARDAVAKGRGGLIVGSAAPAGEAGLVTEPVINAVAGYFYTAEAFLSNWGPDAVTRNSDLMPRITVPVLMLAGTYDANVPAGRLEALKAAAINSPAVDYIYYPDTNHFFEHKWDQSANDTAAWLGKLGLGPEPFVEIELIDTPMADGRHLPGVLYKPEKVDPAKPALILQHGWTGDILHSSNHWLAHRLARAGYVVLAPETRVSGPRGAHTATLADYAGDIGQWIDAMADRGFDRLVLEGHSMGGLWLSNYMSLTDDPRVIGMVYLAPTRDFPQYLEEGIGITGYRQLQQEAEASVAVGRGNTDLIWRKFRRANVDQETGNVDGILFLTKQFLELHGPQTRAVHTARVAEFARPGLAIAGRKDTLMTEKFVSKFAQDYAGELTVEWYENGSHGLRESKDRIAGDILRWLDRTFPASQSAPDSPIPMR